MVVGLRVGIFSFLFGIVITLGVVATAYASNQDLPPNILDPILSETHPWTLDSPFAMNADDFHLSWTTKPLADVSVQVEPDSIQWTRVRQIYVVPRGRLRVVAKGVTGGTVLVSGYTQPLSLGQDGNWVGEIPFGLISGFKNAVRVTLQRDEQVYSGELELHYSPKKQDPERFYVDHSCSPYDFHLKSMKQRPDSWMVISCRLSHVAGESSRTSSLEVFVLWDGEGSTIQLNSIPVQSQSASLWTFRFRSEPGVFNLKSKDQEVELTYRIPKIDHRIHLGLGVGPYAYTYESLNHSVHSVAALATLYGSLSLGEGLKLVTFDATVLHERFSSDWGMYFMIEQNRLFDERVLIRLLLGGHLIGYKYDDSFRSALSFPQGVEIVFSDFIKTQYNLSLGAFLYPRISDVSYNNIWIRWGPPSFFIEYNYISWTQPANNEVVYSRSHGISFGIPLFSAW